jgi:AcrR family transcriptional regulator
MNADPETTRSDGVAPPPAGRVAGTQERIVVAAHALVRQVGIRRMAMERVAELAGISRASLYRHFPNKQALVDAVLEENARRFRRELERTLDVEMTLAEKVAAAARFGHFPPRELALLGLTESDPVSLAMLLTAGAHQFLERAIRFWEPHVREAHARGEVAPDVDPDQGAEWIARSLFGLSTSPGVTFDASDPATFERYASTFIVGGLLGLGRRK